MSLRALPVLAAVGLAGFVLVGSWIERLIFYPSPGVDLRPEQLGVDAVDVFLEPEPGLRVHAFHLSSPGAERAILFLHGNAGNASHRLPNAVELMRMGADVLLLDYRGYGLSRGSPSEAGVYADARAALDHLTGPLGWDEPQIYLFGRSLGGAVAVELAQQRELGGVILESTFTSAADVANSAFFRPIGLLLGDRFDSLARIGHVRAPLLFFHGDRDPVIPHALGRRLFDAAPEPKSFHTLIGAGHNDTVQVGGRPYLDVIRAFLQHR